jgi:phage terminase large subunit-like protein
VAAGHRFDVVQGAYVVWWIERYCRLYEGDHAGEPMVLRGLHSDSLDKWAIPDEWEDAKDGAIERAEHYANGIARGEPADWQYECVMRLFGWMMHSEQYGRWIRRFRRGNIWISKKNKKSPTLAAIALYLTCGDDEPGQKVFIGAKDGSQARENVGKHILEMVESSPELAAACSINRSLMQVTHEESRSLVKPISSGDARTQKSKEGLNGSVLIDETHVVDQEFISRVSRAGISRREPMHLEVSTAGLDPDCYGKRQYDYGKQVESGLREDLRYFFACWEAPQDLSDDELEKDPLKYARMANPAWGHTVHAEEFLDDYNRSKKSVSDLSEFKTYRLDKWQLTSDPWLRTADWSKCAGQFSENDLLGQTCYGAFDLSLKWDTTAIVLIFPNGEKNGEPCYRIWPYIFVTEESARRTAGEIPWRDWERAGHVKITSGNTTDFSLIRRTVREARDKFLLQSFAYDDRFAETVSQELQDEDAIDMVQFNQTPQNFTEPLALLEKDVIDARLEHPDNLCLNWQVGHATKTPKGMLVKPDGKDGIKKIDAVTALVMARQMATMESVCAFWSPEDGV